MVGTTFVVVLFALIVSVVGEIAISVAISVVSIAAVADADIIVGVRTDFGLTKGLLQFWASRFCFLNFRA